jgi:hypothetical protein
MDINDCVQEAISNNNNIAKREEKVLDDQILQNFLSILVSERKQATPERLA